MSIVLLRSFLGSVLSREFGDRSFALMCVLKSIFYEEYVRLCPPGIPAQVEGQADRARPDECRAEGGVRGQVDCGDAHEHAAEIGDQPDRPHGHAEAVEALHRCAVLAREDDARPRGVNDYQDDRQQTRRRVRGVGGFASRND